MGGFVVTNSKAFFNIYLNILNVDNFRTPKLISMIKLVI